MTKFLFCNIPYHGHVNPTLPVVRELINRGAKVTYFCSDEFKNIIQSTGATFRSYMDAEYNDTGFGMESPLMFRCYYAIEQVLDEAKAEKADFLIYDASCLWGKLLSDILNIPAIKSYTTYPLHERFRPFNPYAPAHVMPSELSPRELQSIEVFCKLFNLPRFGHHTVFFHAEPLNIVLFPKELHPAKALFDERFKFFVPSISRDEIMTDFPLECLDGHSVLYVSLGTVHTDLAAVYDICMHAFGNQSRQVVLSIGHQIDREIFGPLPDNVMMYPHVPQLSILQHADIFITHGGPNSVIEACYHAVPLVVIPLSREQVITAQSVEKLGLGVVIKDWRLITAHTLRKSVAQVAENPEFRVNMQRMRESLLKAGNPEKAADAILQLAGNNGIKGQT